MVRQDVKLCRGFGLVLLTDEQAFYLRLIETLPHQRPTYRTPRIEVPLAVLEIIAKQSKLRDLPSTPFELLTLATNGNTIIVQLQGDSDALWCGRAFFAAALDKLRAQRKQELKKSSK